MNYWDNYIPREWYDLQIDPVCRKMANDLLKKHIKKRAKTEYVCTGCGKIFKEIFLKIEIYKVPNKNEMKILRYCNNCDKKKRRGTRGNS